MTSSKNTPRRIELAYCEDPSRYFELLVDRPWAIWLDSGRPHCQQGRYDFMAADPMATVVCDGNDTQVCRDGQCESSTADPFACLRQALLPWDTPQGAGPFSGGAMGYYGYDLAWRLEQLPRRHTKAGEFPDMAVGIYDWVLVIDHQARQAWISIQGRHPDSFDYCTQLAHTLASAKEVPAGTFRVNTAIRSSMSEAAYALAFQRVKHYIQEGDCYQVNLAQRFSLAVEGEPWAIYRALRVQNPAPHAAYFSTPYGEVLSASPERFLKVDRGDVETRPIKGTRPRRADPKQDREQALQLKGSQKDRAENLMIVDLLRNDIGKCCETGSVEVSSLFDVESFATVHHLVSTIRGKLAHEQDALSLLRACFPGGSITGAPKLRAMAIIEELETHRRGVYCGAMGYVGFDGNMDTNIAIRTLVHRQGKLSFWAGGGLVYDSRLEAEYNECLDKASAFFRLFQK